MDKSRFHPKMCDPKDPAMRPEDCVGWWIMDPIAPIWKQLYQNRLSVAAAVEKAVKYSKNANLAKLALHLNATKFLTAEAKRGGWNKEYRERYIVTVCAHLDKWTVDGFEKAQFVIDECRKDAESVLAGEKATPYNRQELPRRSASLRLKWCEAASQVVALIPQIVDLKS